VNDERSSALPVAPGALARAHAPARGLATRLAVCVAFAALTFAGANIVIPLQPVPITLQTLFVLLAGDRGWGATSQTLYVGAGALGLPVFAGGLAGWGIIAGPTGGYLVGFAVAPLVVGALIHRRPSTLWQGGVFVLGTAVIFALGLAHLALFYTHDLGGALAVGLFPFVPGAVLKVVAATSIYRSYGALRARRAA
jgi:biotin transport system substrate-specific component